MPLPTFVSYKRSVNCPTLSAPTAAFSHLELLLPVKKKFYLVVIAFIS